MSNLGYFIANYSNADPFTLPGRNRKKETMEVSDTHSAHASLQQNRDKA